MRAPSKKSVATKPRRCVGALGHRKATKAQAAERRQVGALPFRRTPAGEIEVLLITSRETGRFIIPKGWPMKGLGDPDAAAREAYEEAGVVGKIQRKPVGDYLYWKRLERTFELLKVEVYPLEVRKQRPDWPEKNSRKSGWLSREDAVTLVDEPGLITLLGKFRP
jgi:8-oxo-dGTP pyrophosphatase MutT (NUDIX family)